MPSTSTQKLCSNASETFHSTEDQELSSRDSACLTGPNPSKPTAGKWTSTPERPGRMPCLTWKPNGPPKCGEVNVRSPTSSNGSALKTCLMAFLPACSTTKFPSPLGTASKVTSPAKRMTRLRSRRCFTLSPMPTRTAKWSLEWTLPLLKAKPLS